MKQLLMICVLLVAMASGSVLGAAGQASSKTTPVQRGETSEPSEAGAAGVDQWPTRPLDLPDFMQDDEPFQTQVQQMQIYARHRSAQEIWSMHMAPVLAEIDDGIDASDGLTDEELELFRGQLRQFSADLRELVDAMPPEMTLDTDERLQKADAAFQEMDHDDLLMLHDALKEYPGFWNTPGYALSLVSGKTGVSFAEAAPGPAPGRPAPLEPLGRPTIPAVNPADLQYTSCAGWGDARTCEACPAIDEVAALSAAFALSAASLGVELTCEFLPDKIFIGAATVINFTTLICTGIRAGLDIAAASLEFAVEQHDECEEDYHLALMHLYLDETVMSRASEQSLDFYGLQELRLDIERNLLEEQDTRVSLFQLPESQGGYLDAGGTLSVRYIVLDTIDTVEALGYDVRNARDEYDAAEAHLANGDYKSAYARYRLAYRDAVRVGRELLAVPYPPSP